MQTNKKYKVLITFLEAGFGHIVSAQALADSLIERYGDRLDIECSHFMRDSGIPELVKHEKFFVKEVQKASLNPTYYTFQTVAMHAVGCKNSLQFVTETVYPKPFKAAVKVLLDKHPDMIICTHHFPLYVACHIRDNYLPNLKVIAYNPDNDVHGWWDSRGDYFLVNNKFAYHEAVNKYGFDPDKVVIFPFPVRKALVEANGTKEEYRRQFNIPNGTFAVVLADGIYGKAKLKDFAAELLKSKSNLCLLPIAGKNEPLLKKLNLIRSKLEDPSRFLPLPFVPDVFKLYRACDLFVTKGGPNAILDSVMMGTPVMVNYYASRTEQVSTKLFCEKFGCGIYCPGKVKARKTIEKWAAEPGWDAEFKGNMKRFDKTRNGADDMADFIFDVTQNNAVIVPREEA